MLAAQWRGYLGSSLPDPVDQRTLRPITMLVFVALIVLRWLGWSAPYLSAAETLKMWSIVQLGLGARVIGRPAEKVLHRPPAMATDPTTDPDPVQVVGHRLHPEDRARLVIHLQPVRLHPVPDPGPGWDFGPV